MSIDDDEPSTSSGRPSDNNGQSKPKTQAQIESESVALNIISQLEGCSYDFRYVQEHVLGLFGVLLLQISKCGSCIPKITTK